MQRALFLTIAVASACGGSTKPAAVPPVAPPAATATATATPRPVNPDTLPLPLWPEVHKGTLANGLTYYVLAHHKPEHRAFLWLAVNAGSVDEDDDQRGLAHYDEHMAFNGTKRFPKDALTKYLEGIGMRFGADLNADLSKTLARMTPANVRAAAKHFLDPRQTFEALRLPDDTN